MDLLNMKICCPICNGKLESVSQYEDELYLFCKKCNLNVPAYRDGAEYKLINDLIKYKNEEEDDEEV